MWSDNLLITAVKNLIRKRNDNMELNRIAEELHPRSMAARDWVFQVIRTAIIRGVLPGGMPLRQDEISSSLNVSHIPVREAFRQLEAQGLVRIYPNRGAVVTKLSPKELANVMDTRIMLETGILSAAVSLMTDADIEKADEYLKKFKDESDMENLDSINLKLHFALYKPSGNHVALTLIDQFHANVDRYLHPFYTVEDMPRIKNIAEQSPLIDACRARDASLAKAILRTHLESTKQALLKSPLLAE